MNTIWGISALNHDASITVVQHNKILFAGHSERYSRIKNDCYLNHSIVRDAMSFGIPDRIVWFEKPILKKSRQVYAGQWGEVFTQTPADYLRNFRLNDIPISYVHHHMSHAAAGYYTSSFNDAAIIVVDAIGEWDTISVWHGKHDLLTKIHSVQYPHSIGLLYSAMTQRVGLKPNEEEYILMGMAAYGKPIYKDIIFADFIETMSGPDITLKENVHKGAGHWRPDLKTENDYMNIAASIQSIVEDFMSNLAAWAKRVTDSRNLVIMGGVALNCVANEKIARSKLFKDIWIMPNPGDAGSSLGCIAAYLKEKIIWDSPYLGTNIDRPFDTSAVADAIIKNKIIGIATGRAEFGPRALGNRSLIADPRGDTIKEQVNNIKKRQQFRPFAPIVLEHLAHEYFDLPVKTSPYMQFTAKCLRPDLFPAICHVDGSSRVQTLNERQNPKIYAVLDNFYNKTGYPILLNTSLNIKGEPLVDSWEDALQFQSKYKINIF